MLDYDCLPDYMRGGMQRYIENGIPPGDFLLAVLSNDFIEVISRADGTNIRRLIDYARFLYNELPGRGTHNPDCWGSRKTVAKWIKLGGLKGLAKAEDRDEQRAAQDRAADMQEESDNRRESEGWGR